MRQTYNTGYVKEINLGNPAVAVPATFPQHATVATDATDGAVTWTASQVLGGLIHRTIGAARSDVTPTAALLIAAMGSPIVGQSFLFVVKNVTGATHVLTVTAGSDVTLTGTMTIAAASSKIFLGVVTSATTVTIYSIGTLVH
jgi:hypothetical protein